MWLPNRLLALQIVLLGCFAIIIGRLFYLQVVHGHDNYQKALEQRVTVEEITPQRGRIYVRDRRSDQLITMATNATLDLVYVDPLFTPDKRKVAETLAPLLYTETDHAECINDRAYCPDGSVTELPEILAPETLEEEPIADPTTPNEEPQITFIPPTYNKALQVYTNNIEQKISREKIDFLTIARGVSDEQMDSIETLHLPGVIVLRKKMIVGLDPTQIATEQHEIIARQLAPILQLEEAFIIQKAQGGDLRYVPLKRKIRPEVSEKIRELKRISREAHQQNEDIPDFFRGIVLIEEKWRYYPDNKLASPVIGFVNHESNGQYGIEEKMDYILAGQKGLIEREKDASGQGVVVNPDRIIEPIDGNDVVLTIDRHIQQEAEKLIAEATENYNADSGQILVMEPFSGAVLAMAQSPEYNPNSFGQALSVRRTTVEDRKRIFNTTPLFRKDEHDRLQPSNFKDYELEWDLNFNPEFYVYKNWLGPGTFVNRLVQQAYEPGSVFKPLIMALALDLGEITPQTRYYEGGPVEIGDFVIRTATETYLGSQTMTNVLETSSNVGMTFVAFKLGKAVMHDFITNKMHFGDFTNISLAQEVTGIVKPRRKWSDAALATHSFGQGLTATPLQVARAWCALANGGVLVEPHIIQEVFKSDGSSEKVEHHAISRMVSPDTSDTITAMLVSAVKNGVARPAYIDGYQVAGKTGTSQIAGSDGRYLEGEFITSFIGYAPAFNPKYLVMVKFDRPRLGEDRTYGSTTAAPTFKKMMEFLLKYGEIDGQ
jgi:cell division protein FtsI/penicillin-binding protein 2